MRIDYHQAHLTYCSNIHPGESWEETFKNLEQYATKVARRLTNQPFGIGLRLSSQASLELLEGNHLQDFKAWLTAKNMYVFTINGFPFGQFHGERVKDAVHTPDWTTEDRLEYSKRLFDILAVLLPDGMDGGVSTSPLSYRWWHDDSTIKRVTNQCIDQLGDLVAYLVELKERTGKSLHLDMEPEPDGILETSDEFIAFFDQLAQMLIPRLCDSLNVDRDVAEEMYKTHFQLCYDVCHFAVGFEKPDEALQKLLNADIRIGRIQISAALAAKVDQATDLEGVKQELASFDEPVYLHQAVIEQPDGNLSRYLDLGPGLEDFKSGEIRTHFHVPIFTETYGKLRSTQTDISQTLRVWQEKNFTNHLEVETYTWDVLPEDMRKDLVDSIVRELQWVIDTLNKSEDDE